MDCWKDHRVEDIIRHTAFEISRIKIVLTVLVLELRLEKEYNKDMGKCKPTTFDYFKLLFTLVKKSFSLFDSEEVAENDHPDDYRLRVALETRKAISNKFNEAYKLLTENSDVNNMPVAIAEAHKALSECCEQDIQVFEADLRFALEE